ncbi:hypothetical protein C5167_031950 [Papaver somniferum]|uniref:RNA polymerase subunit H/Rpb5 C-terminal domain-containing protein n=1 Tax=Papaver somniferum TaxID=3469 RepID=A0A4Y7K795_PAPSO|nr:hypothetical protein C5167_031950 [Papaver somniferum]
MASETRMSDEEITRLFRIRRTIMQMLNDRGYLVGDFEINETRAEFLAKFGDKLRREDLDIKKSKRNDNDDHIYVFFPNNPKVNIDTMKICIKRMQNDEVYKAIVVAQQNLTPVAKKFITEFSSKFHMEVFQLPRIQITDPIARYYGLKRGQVVKIIRPSETAGRYVTYRYVV